MQQVHIDTLAAEPLQLPVDITQNGFRGVVADLLFPTVLEINVEADFGADVDRLGVAADDLAKDGLAAPLI